MTIVGVSIVATIFYNAGNQVFTCFCIVVVATLGCGRIVGCGCVGICREMVLLIAGDTSHRFLDLVQELMTLVVEYDEIEMVWDVSHTYKVEDEEGDVISLFQPVDKIACGESLVLHLMVWRKLLEVGDEEAALAFLYNLVKSLLDRSHLQIV